MGIYGKTPSQEALVFVLIGLKIQWKCHIGYLLTEKCKTSFVQLSFNLAGDHGLRFSF